MLLTAVTNLKPSHIALEFSFAGKDSTGKFGEVDIRSMGGICVEYFGEGISMGLVLSREWEDWGSLLEVELESHPIASLPSSGKSIERCYPWSSFIAKSHIDEVISHVQGLRFAIHERETQPRAV